MGVGLRASEEKGASCGCLLRNEGVAEDSTVGFVYVRMRTG